MPIFFSGFVFFLGSSSDSDSSESEQDESQSSRSQEPEARVRVLTEKEMNELGAKILKAELMGNQVQTLFIIAQFWKEQGI